MRVTIDLTDTSGYSPERGDHIVFEAKNLIGSATVPGRIISTAPVTVPLERGVGEVSLEPGPHVMRVKARNYRSSAPIDFTVPEGEDHMTLRELLEGSFEYEPSVVQQAQRYVAQSRTAADRAVKAADRVGSAERVIQAESEVTRLSGQVTSDREAVAEDRVATEQARDTAAKHYAAAERAAAKAAEDAGVAAKATVDKQVQLANDYRDRAYQHMVDAGRARGAAEAAQTGAVEAAGQAEGHEAEAKAALTRSEEFYRQGQNLLEEGKTLSQQGRDDANRAEAARDTAEESARHAGAKATEAESHATAAAKSAESAKQGAPAGGWTKAQLHANVQAQLDKVDGLPSTQFVESAVSGKADAGHTHSYTEIRDLPRIHPGPGVNTLAQRTAQGRLQAQDGAEPFDLVNKRQLDGKLDTSLQSWAVYARDGSGEAMLRYSKARQANMIAVRGDDGVLEVGEPTAPEHAATKHYVDEAVSQEQERVDQELGTIRQALDGASSASSGLMTALKWRAGLAGAGDTLARPSWWGNATLGIETTDPNNGPGVWEPNKLNIQYDGTYTLTLSGSREGAGSVTLYSEYKGRRTNHITITGTSQEEQSVIAELQAGAQLLCDWRGSRGRYFRYRVAFDFVE